MPDTADEVDDHNVYISPDPAPAVSAQRDIDIGFQKTGQRHMPSVPEFGDGQRFIGRVKVLRQRDIEHAADADRHVAVAAEIKIELEGIAQGYQKSFQRI